MKGLLLLLVVVCEAQMMKGLGPASKLIRHDIAKKDDQNVDDGWMRVNDENFDDDWVPDTFDDENFDTERVVGADGVESPEDGPVSLFVVEIDLDEETARMGERSWRALSITSASAVALALLAYKWYTCDAEDHPEAPLPGSDDKYAPLISHV